VPPVPPRSQPRQQWPPATNFGALLRDPALAINQLVSEGLAARGFPDFRVAHGTIGQHISDRGSRVTELAQLAQITKPSVVYLVNDLERHGYVERVPDPDDGRAKLVRLTPQGAEAQAVARELIAQVEHDWAGVLGRRNFHTLRGLLKELHDTLWPA
jgi:DNA-binding MarR family transcriptional regulator